MARSDLYLEGLPSFTRGLVSIPSHAVLVRELRQLERRTARSGRDSVSKGVGSFDDHANSLFGAMYVAAKAVAQAEPPIVSPFLITRHGVVGPHDVPPPPISWHLPSDWGPVGSYPPPGSGPVEW